jgi:hypothetical protein
LARVHLRRLAYDSPISQIGRTSTEP